MIDKERMFVMMRLKEDAMREYLRSLIVVIFLMIFLGDLIAKPERDDHVPKKKDQPIPNISGPSVWGDIEQVGRKISIHKHTQWFVSDGEILPDGRLFVWWIQRSDGRTGPGIYTINPNGSISGRWAMRSEEVYQDEKGEWVGLSQSDVLRHAPSKE